MKSFSFLSFRLLLAAAVLVAVILPTAPVHATVGDSSAQIRAKYGAGRNVKPGMVYGIDEDAYSLTIYFLGDTSVMEIYSKAKNKDGVALPLNGKEITRFLQTNGNGFAWKPMEFKPNAKKPRNKDLHYWYRTDKQIIAAYSKKEGILTFRPMED
ncbi:MAG: hypothetical protein ACAI35_19415 [Candidatus Methylacidiphilales bacterium]